MVTIMMRRNGAGIEISHEPTRYRWRERIASPIDEAISRSGLASRRVRNVWTIKKCSRLQARILHKNLRRTIIADDVKVAPLPKSERKRSVVCIPTRTGAVKLWINTKSQRRDALSTARLQLRYAHNRVRRALDKVRANRDKVQVLSAIVERLDR